MLTQTHSSSSDGRDSGPEGVRVSDAQGQSGSVAYLIQKSSPGVHEPIDRAEVLPGFGFRGDHARKSWWKGKEIPGREVSAISIEALRSFRAAPDVTGDNLVTRGVDLGGLAEGDRLVIGEVVLVRGPKTHRPCALFRSRLGDEAFDAAAAGARGALFVVETGGWIAVDDSITIEKRSG